jgi:hypothetical protein
VYSQGVPYSTPDFPIYRTCRNLLGHNHRNGQRGVDYCCPLLFFLLALVPIILLPFSASFHIPPRVRRFLTSLGGAPDQHLSCSITSTKPYQARDGRGISFQIHATEEEAAVDCPFSFYGRERRLDKAARPRCLQELPREKGQS